MPMASKNVYPESARASRGPESDIRIASTIASIENEAFSENFILSGNKEKRVFLKFKESSLLVLFL